MINKLISVNKKAKLGKNIKIDPFTVIHENVEIGDNCWVGSNVTIFSGARIGKNCKIFPGAIISAPPQDLKFDGQETLTTIGKNTIIREHVTINRGTMATKNTVVGCNCFIMAYCHIAHDCQIGNNCVMANAVNLAGHVIIKDHVIIGGMTAIKQFTKIGEHCMISGGSLVRKDVPPFIKVAKEPLKFLGINIVGLKRRLFNNKKISIIKETYREIFQNGSNTSEAIKIIEKQKKLKKEEKIIIEFIKTSKQGIIKN